MLRGGEDPRFIARRLIILASEDIGNADPMALSVAVDSARAVEYVGLPECRLTLAQATTYLAAAPKSNASYLGLKEALADVDRGRVQEVPGHLKNLKVGEKEDYRYPHDYPGGHVEQEYVGKQKRYYRPTDRGYEATIKKRLESIASKRTPKRDEK